MASAKISTKEVVAAPVAASLGSTGNLRAILPCKLDLFFPYVRLAWGYCSENLSKFTEDSPRFTPEFVQGQITQADTVELLPTWQSRKAAATMAHYNLQVEAQNVKMLSQKLKTYILYAYPNKVLSNTALKEAGLSDYGAIKQKWAKVGAVIISANSFIASNLAKLSEKDNMPAGFPAAFAAAGLSFNAAWKEFLAVEKAVTNGTGTQDEGIRQILAELNPMLETGKRLFIFDGPTRKKFTARYLIKEVSGNKPGGVRGGVTLAATGQPLKDVTVSATHAGEVKSASTNAKGMYKLKLAASIYDLHFAAEGMEPLTIVGREVKASVMGRLSVELRPLPVSAATSSEPVLPPAIESQPPTQDLLQQALEEVKSNGEMANG